MDRCLLALQNEENEEEIEEDDGLEDFTRDDADTEISGTTAAASDGEGKGKGSEATDALSDTAKKGADADTGSCGADKKDCGCAALKREGGGDYKAKLQGQHKGV